MRELGRGAGGVVYLAEDPKIGRQVAIKTISVGGAGASGETLRKRLQREARSAGALAHPNIVTIYELDDDGPFTFVVMEFVEGVTLRDIMHEPQNMPGKRILALLKQVAEGLDFAHARAIVHRDIKPANIMVTGDEVVKIADFGVAKILGDASMGLTQAGMAIGTPHYMSPEQVLGKPVTGQSDQFSLGVIAYELLAGARPFEGDSITSIMYQIVNEDPLLPGVDSAFLQSPVSGALLRALAKEPQDRYPTCVELVSDLEEAVLFNRAPAHTLPAPPASAPVPASPSPAENTAPIASFAPEPVSEPEPETMEVPLLADLPAAPASHRNWFIGAGIVVIVLAAIGYALIHKRAPANPPAPVEAAATEPVAPAHVPAAKPSASSKLAVPPAHPTPSTSQAPQPVKPKADAAQSDAADASAEPKLGVHGTFTWTGSLAAGDSLEVADGQPAAGSVSGRMPPRRSAIRIVEVDPPDVTVDQLPSADNGYTLRLVNSGRDVSNFSVTWRVARKGETTTE